jgi:8-oxo-dGTP pyrophosphatase MutT (NUDIX family)
MAEQQFYVGVHGVIVNRARMLVLRRAPQMSYKPGSWDLPGGHLAFSESAEQCLLREIK